MRALDVMTPYAITVGRHSTIEQVARLFVERGISAAPVVDADGQVVGIVSEGDLLRRAELGTLKHRSRWLEFLTSNRDLAAEYVKSHARHVSDVMSKPVISVSEQTPIGEIADLLESRRIKRVPVLRDGKAVGMVSRANLVQALATLVPAAPAAAAVGDRTIRKQLLAQLKDQKWSAANPSNIVVHDGVIHLWGYVLSEEERRALRVAAENVPGVRKVQDHTLDTPIIPAL